MSIREYIYELMDYDGKTPFIEKYGTLIFTPLFEVLFILMAIDEYKQDLDSCYTYGYSIGFENWIYYAMLVFGGIVVSFALSVFVTAHWPSSEMRKFKRFPDVKELISFVPKDNNFKKLDKILVERIVEYGIPYREFYDIKSVRRYCFSRGDSGIVYLNTDYLNQYVQYINDLTNENHQNELDMLFVQIKANNNIEPPRQTCKKDTNFSQNNAEENSYSIADYGNDYSYSSGGYSSDFVGENDVDFLDLNDNGYDDVVDSFWSGSDRYGDGD